MNKEPILAKLLDETKFWIEELYRAMSGQQRNRSWLIVIALVVLGLLAGLGLGLLLGWVVVPVEYVDTAIADLHPDYKEEYIVLVASAYSLDGDLEKARARLDQLEAPNVNLWLTEMIDRYIAEGRDEQEIQVLAGLAHAMGVDSPQMIAYLATATPTPTDTPLPTPTPTATPVPTMTPVPTDTPVPPTEIPPTDTPVPPTKAPATNTPVPQPTNTPSPPPPTNTPKPPAPTNTPKPPPPTNTPKPTSPPAAQWSIIEQRLLGPFDGLKCDEGNLQIRVTVVDAGGNQISGVWVYDKYSQQYQVTGNVGSPDWGPGQTKFEYGIGGGGSLCIASGEGGGCVSDWTRDMPCYYLPPIEDMHASGYCDCCEPNISLDRCRQLINEGKCWGTGAHHFSWNVVFKRNW